MQTNNEVTCPVCGKLIQLFEHPTKPARLVGSCDCNGGRLREVIEMDNLNYVSESDILEPGEPFPIMPTLPIPPVETTRKRSKNK